jgi:hypothetical protein
MRIYYLTREKEGTRERGKGRRGEGILFIPQMLSLLLLEGFYYIRLEFEGVVQEVYPLVISLDRLLQA